MIFEYWKREYLTLGSLFAVFEPWIWRRLGPVPAYLHYDYNQKGAAHIPIRLLFTISSAIAGILLKSHEFNFFSAILVVILENSDILFGSDYKREN